MNIVVIGLILLMLLLCQIYTVGFADFDIVASDMVAIDDIGSVASDIVTINSNTTFCCYVYWCGIYCVAYSAGIDTDTQQFSNFMMLQSLEYIQIEYGAITGREFIQYFQNLPGRYFGFDTEGVWVIVKFDLITREMKRLSLSEQHQALIDHNASDPSFKTASTAEKINL